MILYVIDHLQYRKGIVVQESIEGFREHLAKLQKVKGLTSEEKG